MLNNLSLASLLATGNGAEKQKGKRWKNDTVSETMPKFRTRPARCFHTLTAALPFSPLSPAMQVDQGLPFQKHGGLPKLSMLVHFHDCWEEAKSKGPLWADNFLSKSSQQGWAYLFTRSNPPRLPWSPKKNWKFVPPTSWLAGPQAPQPVVGLTKIGGLALQVRANVTFER